MLRNRAIVISPGTSNALAAPKRQALAPGAPGLAGFETREHGLIGILPTVGPSYSAQVSLIAPIARRANDRLLCMSRSFRVRVTGAGFLLIQAPVISLG